MRALHGVAEPPDAGGLPARRVVAPQHERRALLRGLQGREHESRTLEHDLHRRRRRLHRVAQPEPAQRDEYVLPQRRDRVAPLDLGLGHRRDRQLDPARPWTLRERRGHGPPRVPGAGRQLRARQLTDRAHQGHDEIAAGRPFVLKEARCEQGEPALSPRRRDEAVRRRGAHGSFQGITLGRRGYRPACHRAERGARDGGDPGHARGNPGAQPMPGRLVVDVEHAADDRAVGMEHHNQSHVHVSRTVSRDAVPRADSKSRLE